MGRYRYSVELGNKYFFGTEIEFSGVYLEKIIEVFLNNSLPVQFIKNHHFDGKYDFQKWCLDSDATVSVDVDDMLFGGELSSRILTDNKRVWEELDKFCYLLQENGAQIYDTCANHVTINIIPVQDKRYFFEVLSLLIILYENDIELFYMGEKYKIRCHKYIYAKNLKGVLAEKIDKIDFYEDNYFDALRFGIVPVTYTKVYAVNLSKYLLNGLIEFRYGNGTLDSKIIQNYINFSLKLVDAIEKKLFNINRLRKLVAIQKQKDKDGFYSKEPDYDSFENLVSTISTSIEDKEDFMSQYDRVVKSKSLR